MIKKLFFLALVLMTSPVYSADKNKEYIEANKGLKAIFAELEAKHPIIAGNFAHYEPALPAPTELPYSEGPKQEIIEVLWSDISDHKPVVLSKEEGEKIEKSLAGIDAMFKEAQQKHGQSKASDESKSSKGAKSSSESSDTFAHILL